MQRKAGAMRIFGNFWGIISRVRPKFGCILIMLVLSTKPWAATKTMLAFGSCNQHDLPQVMWPHIASLEPDAWIWTGDIVYADTENMVEMRKKYTAMKNNPAYEAFRANVLVDGIWDDHDYGRNNAGKEYPKKDSAKFLLMDFLDIPKDHPRYKRRGAYGKRTIKEGEHTVEILMLDGRFFRDRPSEEGDVLGESQWKWLQKELSNPGDLQILVSGTQVLPYQHKYEKWFNFPRSRNRLLQLIQESPAPVMLVSGDRHFGEISRLEKKGFSYPLYELTSSGMTHSWSNFPGEKNDLRQKKVFPEKNFGTIEITWNKNPEIRMQIRNEQGKLSQKRAQSAVNYIINKGISSKRIKARGFGEIVPKVEDAETEQEHQLNRRTEITIIGITKDPVKKMQ